MQEQPTEFYKLIECWRAMPKDAGHAPYKSSFKPADLFSLMPFLFLLEREENGYLAARIVGSELEERLPYSPQGTNVFEAMMQESWGFYDRFMESCGEQLCAGRLKRCIAAPDGLVRTIESLQLPLADSSGRPRFILGVMVVSATDRWENKPPVNKKYNLMGGPKETILKYDFVDVGCGVPEFAVDAAFLQKKHHKRLGVGPLKISREYVQ